MVNMKTKSVQLQKGKEKFCSHEISDSRYLSCTWGRQRLGMQHASEQKILCVLSFISINENRILWLEYGFKCIDKAQVNTSTPPFLREVGGLPV